MKAGSLLCCDTSPPTFLCVLALLGLLQTLFFTVSSRAQAGRVNLASGAPLVMGSVLHDGGGTPGGHLTSLGRGGGSVPLLVNTECSGWLMP